MYCRCYVDPTRHCSRSPVLVFVTSSLSTNISTLVYVLSDIKSAVCFCPVTDISATVIPIGVKNCMIVHIGSGQVFSPFGGDAFKGSPKSQILGLNCSHFSFNREYLENGKSQSIRA